MKGRDELRNQDWKTILPSLTAYAYRHTGRKSWEHAEDLAQQAIVDACDRFEAWDPTEPLLKHLCRRVIGLTSNSIRQKRNSFKAAIKMAGRSRVVWHREEEGAKREMDVVSNDAHADEALDGRRLAKMFRDRLIVSFANDEQATRVIALWTEGTDAPLKQAKAVNVTVAQLHVIRKRIFRHAEQIADEIAAELDADVFAEEREVTP